MTDPVTEGDQQGHPGLEKKWVQFEENCETPGPMESPVAADQQNAGRYSGAVIDTETIQIDIDKVKHSPQTVLPPMSSVRHTTEKVQGNMRNVNLNDGDTVEQHSTVSPPIQRGFTNGDVIVTVLPINTRWPWITPAEFRPELVPEELMAEGLSLTVEDYVQIMETLVHDVRFTAYNLCYKRLLMAWLMASFIVLLGLLFSGAKGITLFGCGVIWLIINAGAIFVCMWIKNRMNHGLEKAVARANQVLVRHRILLGVDDRGKLSCHKTNLCFIYFDTTDCVKKLQAVIDAQEVTSGTETSGGEQNRQREMRLRMDIDDTDIVVAGANPTRISRKQESAERLFLRYAQRWAKEFLRHRLDWSVDESYAAVQLNNPSFGNATSANYPRPRHLISALCPCQFIEDYLRNKPRVDPRTCCCSCALFD